MMLFPARTLRIVAVFLAVLALASCQTASQQRKDVVDMYNQGEYGQAIVKARQALEEAEAAKGPNHPDVAASLNLLALLYYSTGDFNRAEPLYQRALRIRETALGPDDYRTATSLNNLALLYDAMGDYARAEPLYQRALKIREKELDSSHPDLAASYNNLAGLYYALGDYTRAVPLYKKALEIWEKAHGKDHPDVAAGLDNLAGLYANLGDLQRAEPLYRRALNIREKSLGNRHPDVAASYNNLALLLQQKGDLDQAETLYRKALNILETALGEQHPDVAAGYGNLAVLYARKEDYSKAEHLNHKTIDILEKTLGPDHPDVAAALNNLAGLYAAQGRYLDAHQAFLQAQAIDRKVIDQVMGFTSEEKKADFLATRQSSMEGALGLVVQHLKDNPRAVGDAFEVWLSRKGIILEAQRRFQEALIQSDNPNAVKTFQDLTAVRDQLSRLNFSNAGDDKDYRKKIKNLEERKNALEAELSRLSRAYALQRKVRLADADSVSRALPPQSALVEFARINIFDFKAASGNDPWQPPRYVAFLLLSGKNQPTLVDLGSADTIDRAVTDFKKAVSNLRDKTGAKTMIAGQQLYRMVFAPLKSKLAGVDRLFLSPDGNLNLIPFETLSDENGRFLIQEFTINYLSAGRDILAFGRNGSEGKTRKVVLFGDPDFDLTIEKKRQVVASMGLPVSGKQPAVRSVNLRGFRFSRLKGTREEVEAIAQLFGSSSVEAYLGPQALEEVLRNLNQPKILHLATHGFFLSDSQLRYLTGRKKEQTGGGYVNPLARSGLALTGANASLAGGGAEGIVTAEKVLGLKLRGAELVVLSACETGLGEVKSGEGVFGLRRAFTQAGARGLVMSMWSVPDMETKELMLGFYNRINDGGLDRAQALRLAALDQMETVRQRYGNPNPFFWGAFVYLGQP
jgi:CHAT domain-containing protein/Tfp pilus assembly protein PilF